MAKFEKGNTASQIGEDKSVEYVHARCMASQKKRWKEAAKKCGINLSRWICDSLDSAVK